MLFHIFVPLKEGLFLRYSDLGKGSARPLLHCNLVFGTVIVFNKGKTRIKIVMT